MNSFNILIIGAGQIGAFFDSPDKDYVLTHAHAFKKHSGFNLLGFVDSNTKRVEMAANIWGGEAFLTIDDAFSKNNIDVVVVSVSDEYHYQVLKELSKYSFKLVFTEKPLTKTVAEGTEILDVYKKKKIPIIVNYSRRFVPEFSLLKNEISSGFYGKYLSGCGYYGKGTLHNGSHMIDLLFFLFGDINESKTISRIFDHFEDDPSCSAVLNLMLGGKFFMQGIDCRCYSLFELDLLFEQKRIRILDSGLKIEYYEVGKNDIYPEYRELKKVECHDTQLLNAISLASDSIYKFLTLGLTCPSQGDDAILSQKICSNIINGQY